MFPKKLIPEKFILSKHYWIILSIVFILGIYIRFSLPQLPIVDSDTDEYISPGVELIANGSYIPTYRDFLYPCIITPLLAFTQNLYSIIVVQHLSGVVAAVLVVVTIFRLRIFLPQTRAMEWGTRAVAVLAACGLLFSHFTILMEHTIRPEGLFPMACAIAILAGVEVSRRIVLKKYDGVAALWSLIAIVVSIGNIYLKPAWGLTAGASLIPVLLAWLTIPGRWFWKGGTFVLGILLVTGGFIVPGIYFKERLGPERYWFLPGTLLSAHADILYDVIEKDIVRLPDESKEKIYLTTFLRDIRVAKSNPKMLRRHGLAVDPDSLLWGGPVKRLFLEFKDPAEFARMCYRYYFLGWLKYPFAMLWKIVKQMEFFYSPSENNVYSSRHGKNLNMVYHGKLKEVRGFAARVPWPPLVNYLKTVETLNFPEETTMFRAILASTVVWLNYLFLPMAVLSVIGAVGILLSGNRLSQLRVGAFMVLYVSSFNFFMSVTISVVHMMDVARYYFGQVTMSLVSQGFQFLFLFALIRALIFAWKERKAGGRDGFAEVGDFSNSA